MAFSIVFLGQLVQLVGNFCRDAFNRIVQRIVTNQIQPGERLKVPSAKNGSKLMNDLLARNGISTYTVDCVTIEQEAVKWK